MLNEIQLHMFDLLESRAPQLLSVALLNLLQEWCSLEETGA